jgi:hypothetical protein
VSYTIAKQLKELGYNEPSLMVYYGEGKGEAETGQPKDKMYLPSGFGKVKNSDLINFPKHNIYNQGQVTAPLYQQVVDWFREEHGVHISAKYYTFGVKSCNGWYYSFNDGREQGPTIFEKYNSYYDALNAGINEAINQLTIIKQYK